MIGGLDVYIRNTVMYTNNSFEFVIVHGRDDKHTSVIKEGEPVREIGISLYREINPWRDVIGLVEAIKAIHKEKPDLIHCHSAKGGMIGRIAGWLTNTRTLYTPHAFSYLSTPSALKRKIYLWLERLTRFNAILLACSNSERELGIRIIHYKQNKAQAWNNAVPDALAQINSHA